MDQLPPVFINELFDYSKLYKLILIGCSNDMNLTNTIYQSRSKEMTILDKPEILEFTPYTQKQILDILTSMYNAPSKENIFEPAALEICSRKVSVKSFINLRIHLVM